MQVSPQPAQQSPCSSPGRLWSDGLTPTCRPQITSEQIVREAKELQEKDFKPPTQLITNEVELGEYRLRKRKEYEDTLRMKRWNLNVWRNVSC